MKDKPTKPGKGSKKGKNEANSTQEVELTPKQLKEKRREEARAKAAETRKIVTAGTGQWTGKLPAQLLNEHAQKMKWERVEYPVKPFGREPNQEWVASVMLARKNPKSREVERVRFDPPSDRVPKQPTQVEARHLAATYGLHRILSHRNMKMMLPPLHQNLWAQLDIDKANAKPHESYKWGEDPWKQELDRKEAKLKFEAAKEQRERSREQMEIAREVANETKTEEADQKTDSQVQKVKRVRFNNSLIMSKKTRAVIEQIIRENDGFRFSTSDALDAAKYPDQHKKLSQMLVKLGFHPNFVTEALEYTSQLSSALTWLLIHVPEDDIPKSFMPSEIGGVTARVSSSIQVENVTSRLREFGYSEDLARSTAEKYQGSLVCCVAALSSKFCTNDTDASHTIEQSISGITLENTFWSEEVETLQAIFDNDQLLVGNDELVPSCVLISKSSNFKLHIFKTPNYPHSLPGIAIESLSKGGISKVSQLDATRQAVIHAHDNLIGDYTMMALFNYMEEIFENILRVPPKLSQISSGITGVDEVKLQKEESQGKRLLSKNGNVSSKRRNVRAFDRKEISQETAERMSTADGKNMIQNRANLPAWEKQAEIASIIKDHQVVIITGETGSGKSTQAVQFILDSEPDAQIICTQPRRISAIGVAQRVADERLVNIGEQVGYVIRGEAKISAKTQIRFMTSGVLLRILQGSSVGGLDSQAEANDSTYRGSDGLAGITHIFVDEVHERSLDSDFLLILLKSLVKVNNKIKVVLMSATVDPEQFISYFSPCKVGYTHITGRTFPVKQFYLDEVLRRTGYIPNAYNKQVLDDDGDDMDTGSEEKNIGKIIGSIRMNTPGRVDFNLVAATVQYIHLDLKQRKDEDGSILIFMSGADEIDRTLRAIKSSEISFSIWALPLHASLSPMEQKKVFRKAPKGLRKVIASTNVAETSITISDIVAVIDSGRVKETIYDAEANVSRLVDVWTSQAAAAQRKGRAGRVRAGECFKLYTENAENQRMPKFPLPEILRSPLEILYLNVKAMGISNVEQFLDKAIDPPEHTTLETAKRNLISYGAIDSLHSELTPLGRHISKIPADTRISKLLVLAVMMGCLSKCLTIAAILNVGKLPFRTEKDNESKNTQIFLSFDGDSGDLLAASKAFDQWENGSVNSALVSANVCRDIRSARRQLLSSLVQIGFVTANESEVLYSKYDNSDATVCALIGAALYPNVVEIAFPQQKFMATATGAVEKEGIKDSREIKLYSSSGDRVFTHPRSLYFGKTAFASTTKYLGFGNAVLTTKHFIAEITPLSVYGIALFATRIGVDPLGNGIIIDKWTGLKCWPRAGILLQFLQQLLSRLMDEKFRDPSANFIEHPVVQLVHDLLESEGQPQGIGLVT